MGYETAPSQEISGGGIISSQPNGTYTDNAGNTNIGDFRLAYGPVSPDCGGAGEAMGVLAYAYNPSSAAVPGNGGAGVKTTL